MLYKKLYKNISVVALGTALFSLPVFTACESDVVDLEPVDKFSELTAYGTEERCELAVVGAYDAAQCGMYVDPNDFGWARGYPFGAASILQGEMRGEDMNLTAQFYDYTYSATTVTVVSRELKPGRSGGRIVAVGTPEQIRENAESVTGQYL